MMSRVGLCTLAVLLLSFLSGTAAAEILYVKKTGLKIEGKVIRKNGWVTISSSSGLYQFKEDEVSKEPTALKSAENTLPVVIIKTNFGDIKCELFEDDAPNTVANFIYVAEQGIYDGTLFHRVISDFMIQGGDPLTKGDNPSKFGTGGPGWCIPCEINHRKHKRHYLSMAHAGKDTGGCQFFITLVPTPHLDGKHTVFGRVIDGGEIVDKIGSTPVNSSYRPLKPVRIEKVVVVSKRNHEYIPKKLPARR